MTMMKQGTINLKGFGTPMPPRRRPLFGLFKERERSSLFYSVTHSPSRNHHPIRWKFLWVALASLLIVYGWGSRPTPTLYFITADMDPRGSVPLHVCRLDPPWGIASPTTDIDSPSQQQEEKCKGSQTSRPSTTAVGLTCPLSTAHSLPPKAATTGAVASGPPPQIAVVLLYYASPAMLLRQLNHYGNDLLKQDPTLQQTMTLLIVDDGSPPGLRAEEYLMNQHDFFQLIPNLHLVQIDQDLPWNQPGARNLALHTLGTLYGPHLMVVVLDLDLLLPLPTLQSILSMALTESSSSTPSSSNTLMAHSFNRTRPDGITYKEHPSAMAILVQDWWQGAGGMDEDFSGHYGSEDTAFWWKWEVQEQDVNDHGKNNDNNNNSNQDQRQKRHHTDWILSQFDLKQGDCDSAWITNPVQREKCVSAKQQHQRDLEQRGVNNRNTNLNVVKLKRKIQTGCWSNIYLRFPWHYVQRP